MDMQKVEASSSDVDSSKIAELTTFFRNFQAWKNKVITEFRGCTCERYFYCDQCYPVEIREGGMYSPAVMAAKDAEWKQATGFTTRQLFDTAVMAHLTTRS
jgi:hypothetical protein